VPKTQGFVVDYANAISRANQAAENRGRPPFEVDPGVIMNCYAPASLPVINGPAQARTDVPEITPVTPPPFTGRGSELPAGLQRGMLVAAAMFVARKADRYIHPGSLKARGELIAALDRLGESFLAW